MQGCAGDAVLRSLLLPAGPLTITLSPDHVAAYWPEVQYLSAQPNSRQKTHSGIASSVPVTPYIRLLLLGPAESLTVKLKSNHPAAYWPEVRPVIQCKYFLQYFPDGCNAENVSPDVTLVNITQSASCTGVAVECRFFCQLIPSPMIKDR